MLPYISLVQERNVCKSVDRSAAAAPTTRKHKVAYTVKNVVPSRSDHRRNETEYTVKDI